MSAYVYRCYDSAGLLLYIGCAFNPKRRIATHLRSRRTLASHALQVLMDRYEIEGPFRTREAADDAERAAIQAERPLLNRQHNGGANWLADRELAAYLADRAIPLDQCGLHQCSACGILRSHHRAHGLCSDCRDADAAGRLAEWLESVA